MAIAFRSATEALEKWERWPSEVLTGQAEKTAAAPVFLVGILPQEEFLERLRFEKRRVDLSGNPISMALFFLKEELLTDARKLRELLISIKRATRETDLKGWVNGSIFGLLMLDTDYFSTDAPGQKGEPLQFLEVPVHEIRERRPGSPRICAEADRWTTCPAQPGEGRQASVQTEKRLPDHCGGENYPETEHRRIAPAF